MISVKSKKLICEKLGIKETDFDAAVAAETETDLTIDEKLQVFTEAKLTERDTQMKTEGSRAGEAIGEQKGKELAAKAIKSKLGITDETKDVDKVAELAFAQIKNDGTLKSQVEGLLSEKQKLELKISEYETNIQSLKGDTELMTYLPANRADIFETQDWMNAVKTRIKKTDAGYEVNGQLLRDPQSQAPLGMKEAVSHLFANTKGWLKQGDGGSGGDGGRGGGDDKGDGTTVKNIGDWKRNYRKKNPTASYETMGMELTKFMRENKEIDQTDDYEGE
jgi:hypothetical protein